MRKLEVMGSLYYLGFSLRKTGVEDDVIFSVIIIRSQNPNVIMKDFQMKVC
jgi:hypothetical protein